MTSTVLAPLLLAGSLLPGIASAARDDRAGAEPSLGRGGELPQQGHDPSVIYVDCAFVSTEDPTGVSGQAPADGTITKWRMAGFQGSAKLLVLEATGGGKFEIVQRSAEESEPCVDKSGICIPAKPVRIHHRLPIKKGQFIGVEASAQKTATNRPKPKRARSSALAAERRRSTATPADDAPATPDESNGRPAPRRAGGDDHQDRHRVAEPGQDHGRRESPDDRDGDGDEEGKPVSGQDVSF